MTNEPSDPIDPYEHVLARRVGQYAERGVQPIDAGQIARDVVRGTVRRGPSSGIRAGRNLPSLGLALLAGVVLVAVGGAVIGGGRKPSSSAPAPTTAPVAGSVSACSTGSISAQITAWSGAAGSRIATVTFRNVGTTRCSIQKLGQPGLVDGAGHDLIIGKRVEQSARLEIAPNGVASTLVDASNYCGQDAPIAPISIQIAFPDGTLLRAESAQPMNLEGVPPCNGPTGSAGSIQMQPFALVKGT